MEKAFIFEAHIFLLVSSLLQLIQRAISSFDHRSHNFDLTFAFLYYSHPSFLTDDKYTFIEITATCLFTLTRRLISTIAGDNDDVHVEVPGYNSHPQY